MIEKLSNKILNLLICEEKSEEEKEILLFGITRIVEDIPKAVGIILIGILLGIIKQMLVVTIVIACYKTFTGGVHAKTNWGCFIYSVLFYLIIIYLAKYVILYDLSRIGMYILIYIFSIYTIIVYAPADVPEIPKVDITIRKTLKIKSFISLNLIYIVTIFFINNILIQNLILYTVLFIGIMTTRSVYKLFKSEYGYETYIPDELI